MDSKILLRFNRDSNIDLGEKIGNVGLGLLRIGFGKTVEVRKISGDSHKPPFHDSTYSTSVKVAAVALFILALPVTIIFTGIGCIGQAFSKSHAEIFDVYLKSRYQRQLHADIQSMRIDPQLFQVRDGVDVQAAIGQMIQSVALPLYKKPILQTPSYREGNKRVLLHSKNDTVYNRYLRQVANKLQPSRRHHGTMHCVRVTLWTQLLSKVYERAGRDKPANPILLATAGAFHDAAREGEGIDYWDTESSEALGTLLSHIGIRPDEQRPYIQAIKDKDPKNRNFSSDIQRIVHDADCLDIIRLVGKAPFGRRHLCFYHFSEDKSFYDRLIDEIADFIELTDTSEVRNQFEHHSENFYKDLVQLLFIKEGDRPKFPNIVDLLQEDMAGLNLGTPPR